MIELARDEERDQHIPVATIKVVGVGGAGGNTVNCMIASDYKGVEFIAVNTDAQALQLSKAHKTIQIGQKSTKGLGAGANPEVGKRAAEEDLDKVLSELHDADIVFLAAGMGGGTGSGALPVITKALKEKGILTIVVLTKPFQFEGKRRAQVAEQAIAKVREYADTLLIVPNQKLLDVVDDKVSMIEGFDMINEVLNQSVKGVSDIITRAGHINVDFADVREIMRDQGLAVMGTGRAQGQDRARKAAVAAISSPLLENMNIAGAKGVLLNISGNAGLGLHEISAAASVIYEQADPDANIILGSVIDDSLGEEVAVTVIATGFDEHPDLDLKIQGTLVAKELYNKPKVVEQKVQQQEFKQEYKPEQKEQPKEFKQEVKPQEVAPVKEIAKEVVVLDMKPVQPAPVAPKLEELKQEQKAEWKQQEQKIQEYKEQPVKQEEKHVCQHHHHHEKQEKPVQAAQKSHEQQNNNSGLGSNVIQLKDVDVPTFMRKQHTNDQYHNNHKKNKKNKHKWHQQNQQQYHRDN